METAKKWTKLGLLVVVAGLLLAGCTGSYHTKFGVLHGGHTEREHPRPMEGGYYQDFDPQAAALKVTPMEDTNPVMTQHVLIASVMDEEGNLLPNRRVEWIIPDESVGAIVEVDESGWYASRGYKVDNQYAVSHTNNNDHVLTRGNDDPSDDIHLKKGQTWCVITSAVEGTTNLIAFAPAINNWDEHKVFVRKHWADAAWEWPADAINTIGTPHEMMVKVMKYSDGTPITNATVTFEVIDGPAATFASSKTKVASVDVDKSGVAKVTLNQAKPVEGVNTIKMDIVRGGDDRCCEPSIHLATGTVTKTWVGPRIDIEKTAPAQVGLNDEFTYNLVFSNPGKAPATNVKVVDPLPAGIAYVSSTPNAQVNGQELTWSLGTIPPGGSKKGMVRVKATETGRFNNCAVITADHNLQDRACAPTIVVAPALKIEKTGPAEVLVCDPITYQIVVSNTGDGPATNVKVVDQLPAGMTTSAGQSNVSLDLGTIDPGKAKRVTYTTKVQKAGKYDNTAVAAADGNLKAQANHSVMVRQPALAVTKSGPEMRFVDRTATYEVKVTNTGDGIARDTVLVDTIPAGMEFESATNGGTFANGKVTWNLGSMAPNDTKSGSVTLRARQIGRMTNRVVAQAYCAQATAEATTEIKGIPALLLEVIDLDDPIEVGMNETYVITVTNQGSAVGTGIAITATLPAEQEYVSSEGPTNATVDGRTVTYAPLPQLAPKARAVYRLTTKATGAGDVRFGIQMHSDQITRPVMETESTNQYE